MEYAVNHRDQASIIGDNGLFIAGTDTGVGKTCVTVALLGACAAADLAACGMKPVASGAGWNGSRLINTDASDIAAVSPRDVDFNDINPYCFEAAISPHIAALRVGQHIDIGRILGAYERLRRRSRVVVVEGTGGWLAPINEQQTMADIAVALRLPVVLVVGLRLGCLNHALLTAAAIRASGLEFAGWIGNAIDPEFAAAQENIATLHERLEAPALALLPHAPNTGASAAASARISAMSALLGGRHA